MAKPPSYLIWMNGFPGVGKYTIAKELKELLGHDAALIDNHQLIDVVNLPRDHPEYQPQRKLERARAFQRTLFDDQTAAKVALFTDFQSDNDLGKSVAAEYKAAAEEARRIFLPVYVTCAREENLARVASSERIKDGKGKLVDQALVMGFLDRCRLFQWYGLGVHIDVTSISPKEAALQILAHVDCENKSEEARGEDRA